VPSEPIAPLDSAAGDPTLDATAMQVTPAAGDVVPLVGMQLRWPLPSATAGRANRGNCR
jgi:hypothetical protein